MSVHDAIQPRSLTSQLYPFQRRAVSWLLEREGFTMDRNGKITPIPIAASGVCPSFHPTKDADNRTIYASQLMLGVMNEKQRQDWNANPLRGGILAEEMGLGKTVELIALISLNRRLTNLGETVHDDLSGEKIRATPSTLIITPHSIRDQWKSEIHTHAPNLKVYIYQGVNREIALHIQQAPKGRKHITDDDVVATLMQHDVVLATYNDLSREIWFAQDASGRELRHAKKYEARRSPLVKMSWWRVCLDEAQMIESGVSNAATVARRIPRVNSWAVSGTPFKGNLSDLQGLLIFLRYEPFCNSAVWDCMLEHHPEVFKQIFGTLAMRHTKASVRKDLRIPPQKRVVISVPFAAIEEQHYSELFKTMCDEVGVHKDGSPKDGQWDPESTRTVERMRSWLTRLRQTCLHPEVGGSNRRALGWRGDGPIRTLDQVLDVMTDQNEVSLRSEEKLTIMAKVTQGHILSFGNEPLQALETYEACLKMATKSVNECRSSLTQADLRKVERRRKAEEARDMFSEESDSEQLVKDEDGKYSKMTSARFRLRSALETLHVCCFFTATAYYQVKVNPGLTTENSDKFHELEKKEAAAYEDAKAVRRELLRDVSSRTSKLMSQVEQSKKSSFVALPQVRQLEDGGGIESRKVLQQADLVFDMLNRQASQAEEWRSKIVESLLISLIDQEGEVELTGEEYEETTIRQDEQYAYIDGLRALVADRNTALAGQANLRINNEMKEAMRLAREEQGPAPKLMRELLEKRAELRLDASSSIRGLITDVRQLVATVKGSVGPVNDARSLRAQAEAHILEQYLTRLSQIFSEQTKSITRLERELDLFRSTQNERLDYYRQLQNISDAVAPLQEEMDERIDVAALQVQKRSEEEHQSKLDSLITRRRYLQHLKADASGETERMCIICQCPFEMGVLTVCGHQYCRECLLHWYRNHRSCPLCKRKLKSKDFHTVMYKPQELRAQEETASHAPEEGDSPSSSTKTSIYSQVSQKTLDEIKAVDLRGTFGTKLDTLARHILWLRVNDPGAKSVIFSQYGDFIHVLEGAFSQFRIGCSSIRERDGVRRFQEDASVECFLLHAKANSSGLNLVNATHVFLCEPLINAAIELQVIARVHRIGQARPTTVWMYLVRDTVEEAIYDISVSRRLTHLQTSTRSRSATPSAHAVGESALDAANSAELEGANLAKMVAKGESGGELVPGEDLWSCLFGRAGRPQASEELEREVGRHLRAEAAERRSDGRGVRRITGSGT